MLLEQIRLTNVKYLEATVNPSNEACKKNIRKLAESLNTKCEETLLFDEKDFENDGHEAEVLYRVGPLSQAKVKSLIDIKKQVHE